VDLDPAAKWICLSPPLKTSHRSAFLDGYSLHADRLVDENDRDSLERLCRYGSRSPVAHTRLSLDASGRVVVALRRPLHDGRTALAFTPIEVAASLRDQCRPTPAGRLQSAPAKLCLFVLAAG